MQNTAELYEGSGSSEHVHRETRENRERLEIFARRLDSMERDLRQLLRQYAKLTETFERLAAALEANGET